MKKTLVLGIVVGATLAVGLGLLLQGSTATVASAAAGDDEITRAVCVLMPTQGSMVKGVIEFTKTDGGVRVHGHVEGLTPGDHGFHIHQWGDCSSPDGSAAGDHFNPGHDDHGGPDDDKRHVGDMGNITAAADGTAHFEREFKGMGFTGDASIIGRGLVVHASADDLTSQPSGNAGARIACGVIGIADPEKGMH